MSLYSDNELPLETIRQIAEARFVVKGQSDDVTLFIECPGGPHRGAGFKDTWVKLDRVPTVDCRHGKCADAIIEANDAFRSELRKAKSAFNRGLPVTDYRSQERQPTTPPKAARCTLNVAPSEPTAQDLNNPDAFWIYPNSEGKPIGATARHNNPDGSKRSVLPWVWLDGKWQNIGFGENRPLYGLHLLAARPNTPVLVVEGEKTADAASVLFPEFVVMTWQGGSGSIGKADWSPLNDRDVTMWPDADDDGRKAAMKLAGVISGLRIVDISGLPKKWDLADPLPDGWTLERLREAVDKAVSVVNAPPHSDDSADSPERSLPQRGTFPVACLPPICRAYAEELARVYQVPVELPAMCIVGVITGALGGSWELRGAVNGHKTGGNMYFALGLLPGEGKGIVNQIAKPIAEWERLRREKWEREGLPRLEVEYDTLKAEFERHAKALRDGDGDKEATVIIKAKLAALERRLDFDPSLMEQNSTTSGLARKMSQVEKQVLWVFSPDGGDVFRTMLGAYTKGADAGDFDLWLKGFSRERHQQTRAARQGSRKADVIDLTQPCLSALLMVQPSILREVIGSKEARERGLLTRVLPIPISVPLIDDDAEVRIIDSMIESAFNELVTDILFQRFAAVDEPYLLTCEPEAREVFRAFHNETRAWARGPLADFRIELSRWRELALRLCVGLAVAGNPQGTRIDAETAKRAVELFRWCGIGALELFAEGRGERLQNRADKLAEALRRAGGERTVRRLRDNGFEAEELAQLARLFPRRFRIEERKPQDGGRTSSVVTLLEYVKM